MMRIVLCNCPPSVGETLARKMVEARLAACVNISAPIQSVYRWKGVIEREQEVTLFIKTAEEKLDALREWLAKEHPYELPEVLALAVDPRYSSAAYIQWVRDATLGEG